jgi:catechol 2,3-dioxygenase-like lactoylglutathione lyase family enzyme
MRSETMLVVRDVVASSAWYQRLLGCKSGHGGPDFEMLVEGDALLLMLHRQDSEEHAFGRSGEANRGAGVCVYFRVEDLDAVHRRAVQMKATILGGPKENSLAHQRELELQDPDGYFITICQ